MILTSATDTADLLGSFEQLEPRRAAADALLAVEAAVRQVVVCAVTGGHFDAAVEAFTTWTTFERCMLGEALGVDAADAAQQLDTLMSEAASVVSDPSVLTAWQTAFSTHAAHCRPQSDEAAVAGAFRWVDGILLTAMEKGDWVFLDNANLCSPTVLDRLNPALEPDGVLLVPEAGTVDGQPRCVVPAASFRLIMGVDPRHGEASRAMRNRGIEVFITSTGDSGDAADEENSIRVVRGTRHFADLVGDRKVSIRARALALSARPSFAKMYLAWRV